MRGASTFRSAALLLGGLFVSGTVSAQTLVNTLELARPSAATRIEEALDALAKARGWTYDNVDCEQLRRNWETAENIAILTTTDCLGFPVTDGSAVSANIAFPVYFFAREAGKVLSASDRYGLLSAFDANYRFPLEYALRTILNADQEKELFVNTSNADYTDLLGDLKGGQVSVICVIDDGTGVQPAALRQAAAKYPLKLHEVNPPLTAASSPKSSRDAGIQPLALPVGYVDGLRSTVTQQATGAQTVLAFTVPKAEAGEAPDDAPSSIFGRLGAWFRSSTTAIAAEGKQRTSRALPAAAPILLRKGKVDAALVETVRRALLAAPLDAWINPCHADKLQIYRSFLRAAIPPTKGPELDVVAAALWEQATLLETRGGGVSSTGDAEYFKQSLLSGSDPRALVRLFTDKRDQATCPVPRKTAFGSATDRQKFYKHARRRLRDALAAKVANSKEAQEAREEAGACLREAFRRDGETPECGEPLHGMWTNVYAPYLLMAILETEKRDVPRP